MIVEAGRLLIVNRKNVKTHIDHIDEALWLVPLVRWLLALLLKRYSETLAPTSSPPPPPQPPAQDQAQGHCCQWNRRCSRVTVLQSGQPVSYLPHRHCKLRGTASQARGREWSIQQLSRLGIRPHAEVCWRCTPAVESKGHPALWGSVQPNKFDIAIGDLSSRGTLALTRGKRTSPGAECQRETLT